MVRTVTSEEVVKELLHQEIFYRFSGGGVTFSGGEATSQPEFLQELTDALYDEGISVDIETSGYFDYDTLIPTLRKMDRVFMDLKHTNSILHKKYTGVDNSLILDNIRKVSEEGIPLVVRIPVIVGFNEDSDAMESAFSFLHEQAPKAQLEFLPFHTLGEEKYRQLGRHYQIKGFSTPSAEEIKNYTRMAEKYDIEVVSFK